VLVTDTPPTSHSMKVGATGMVFIGTSSELAITGP
jgi:hypothetical protein